MTAAAPDVAPGPAAPEPAQRAAALLDEGRALDAVLAMFEAAALHPLQRLIALRTATGLCLRDAMQLIYHSDPLSHVTRAYLGLLAEHPLLPGEYGAQVRALFCYALLRNEPELALSDDGDGIRYGALPDAERWGWMSGRLADLRQAVEDLADHPLASRITLTPTGLHVAPG